jgi:hypothetical protein
MKKLLPLLSLALVLAATAVLPGAPARADMVVERPVALGITGTVEGSRLIYRITNPSDAAIELAQPRVVMLERGMRLPVRITAMNVDGRAAAVSEPFTLAAGQTLTMTLTLEALRHGDLEMRFTRGNVEAHRMAV